MDSIFVAGVQNFLSPPVLCFLLGLLAGFSKSDLYVPDQLAKGLSMFLMFAIGLHGGMGASSVGWSWHLVLSMITAILLSFTVPFICQYFLRLTTKHDNQQIAAISAHYGSISIVTFATAMELLKLSAISYESSLIPMAALMETPAILAGFFLIHKAMKSKQAGTQTSSTVMHEVFLNGAIFLLLGGFFIGCVASKKGLQDIHSFFFSPFKGILCFFLLELGLTASRNFIGFKKLGWSLILFGIYMPFIGATLGAFCGMLIGLSLGGTVLLAVLTASASYIAVPAAMKAAFPHIDNSVSISLSLGITFPFNIFIGIPLYLNLVSYAYAVLKVGGLN